VNGKIDLLDKKVTEIEKKDNSGLGAVLSLFKKKDTKPVEKIAFNPPDYYFDPKILKDRIKIIDESSDS
jgi:hypothetical protein